MDDIQKAAKEFGRMGGKATSDKYGPEHYRKMQAIGVKTKLAKRKIASKDILDKPLLK